MVRSSGTTCEDHSGGNGVTQTDGLGGVDSSAEYIVDNNVAPILSERLRELNQPGDRWKWIL
jgi:hypothetical protein